MFLKGTSDHTDHLQYITVLTPLDNAKPNQQEATNHGCRTRSCSKFYTIRGINTNFNLEFATQVRTLQEQHRQFSSATPLHHIFGFCRHVRKIMYRVEHSVALVRKGNDNDAIWSANGVADGKVFLN